MKKKVQVFIASPNDLPAERNTFRKAIEQLNVGFGEGANVEFEALGWKETLASTGRRSQSVINEEIDECDVFVLTLYRRWGTEAPDAAALSKDGKIEYARQKFSQLIIDSSNIGVLYLGFEFFYRTGDLDSAKKALEKWLDLSGREVTSATTTAAYGNLGFIYYKQGDLERAEKMYQKSLAINAALSRKEGMANQYGSLRHLYKTQGNLKQAEEFDMKGRSLFAELNSPLEQKVTDLITELRKAKFEKQAELQKNLINNTLQKFLQHKQSNTHPQHMYAGQNSI